MKDPHRIDLLALNLTFILRFKVLYTSTEPHGSIVVQFELSLSRIHHVATEFNIICLLVGR